MEVICTETNKSKNQFRRHYCFFSVITKADILNHCSDNLAFDGGFVDVIVGVSMCTLVGLLNVWQVLYCESKDTHENLTFFFVAPKDRYCESCNCLRIYTTLNKKRAWNMDGMKKKKVHFLACIESALLHRV